MFNNYKPHKNDENFNKNRCFTQRNQNLSIIFHAFNESNLYLSTYTRHNIYEIFAQEITSTNHIPTIPVGQPLYEICSLRSRILASTYMSKYK